MRVAKASAWTLVAALTVTGLAGCSGDDEGEQALTDRDGAEVIELVGDDMAEINAMHVAGVTEEAGTTVTFDLSTDRVGHCTGTMSIGAGTSEFVTDGEQFFIKGDEAFWSSTTEDRATARQVLAFIGDKWALVEGAEFEEFCDLPSMLEGIGTPPEDAEVSVADDLSTHRGVDVVKVRTERENGDVTTTLVTAEAPHRIVRSQRQGSAEATLELSEFDEPVRAQLPAAGDYVDLAELTK